MLVLGATDASASTRDTRAMSASRSINRVSAGQLHSRNPCTTNNGSQAFGFSIRIQSARLSNSESTPSALTCTYPLPPFLLLDRLVSLCFLTHPASRVSPERADPAAVLES